MLYVVEWVYSVYVLHDGKKHLRSEVKAYPTYGAALEYAESLKTHDNTKFVKIWEIDKEV